MRDALVGRVVPNAPQSIAASVMAGLAKKPEDRPKNCAAVLEYEDLQGCSARIAAPSPDREKIARLFADLNAAFAAEASKDDIVRIMHGYLPNFEHIETGKSLDSKM